MESRNHSAAHRIAVAWIAICALLGQAFLSPAAAHSRPIDTINCGIDGPQSNPAGGENRGAHVGHGDCCIIACASCCWLALTAAVAVVFGSAQTASRVAFADAPSCKNGKPERFYLAARGPPLSL